MDYSKKTKQELIELLQLRDAVAVSNSNSTYELVRKWGDEPQENFIVVYLNGALKPINVLAVTKGLVNRTLVHPREVFAPAIEKRATAVVLAHNHPSGNLEASEDDLNVTNVLIKAGNILGIKVLDHIIFDSCNYLSMKEQGLIYFDSED